MHSRNGRLLTGATLTLLVVTCAAALGASNAAPAARSSAARTALRDIASCGSTLAAPGTYELTKSLTDSGSGNCITLKGNSITLYLDGHTVTGTGSDTCIYVEGDPTNLSTNQTVIGGTKAKPTTPATLTNCNDGLSVYGTSRTTASHLNVVAPVSYGVYGYETGGMQLSNVNVLLHSSSANGFYLKNGSDNLVTKSTVDNNSSSASFYAYEEVGDTFSWDTAEDTYSNSGNLGTGFYERVDGSNDTYTHDTSKGHLDGFYFASDVQTGAAGGAVTATYDTATGPSAANSYGFYVYKTLSQITYSWPLHTTISHNKTNGFQYGYYDETDPSFVDGETWIGNTADNYSQYGFDMADPTDYTMTGNIADGNTTGKMYPGGTTYGFFMSVGFTKLGFASFAGNAAYDSEYGFYSLSMIGGKGNIAKRDKYDSALVEITG